VIKTEQHRPANGVVSQPQPQSASLSLMNITSILFWCLSIALIAFTVVLILQSLDWKMINDPPYIHYIAWMMSKGAVPYRDVFDVNFPGTYLLHLFIIKVFGTGDLAWRIFDLFLLGMIDLFIIAYCRAFGALSTVMAVSLFSGFHLAGGEFACGQRDWKKGFPFTDFFCPGFCLEGG